MTTAFDKLRRLDAARRRGAIDRAEHARRRAAILDTVEEAQPAPTPPPPRQEPRRRADAQPVRMAAGVLVGLTLLTLAVAHITKDFGLSLTLTITLLAAFVFREARALGALDLPRWMRRSR